MTDEHRSELDLDRFWDHLVRGERADAGSGLAPEQAETLRRIQALARAPVPGLARERAWRRLVQAIPTSGREQAANQAGVLPSLGSLIGPNGHHAPATPRRAQFPVWRQRRSWPIAQLTTALMVLITMLGVYVVFRPEGRQGDGGDGPAGPMVEVIAEAGAELPPDNVHIYLHRYRVLPGPAEHDVSDGPIFGSIEGGQAGVQIGDEAEQVFGPGEVFVVPPETTLAVRNPGEGELIYLEVRVSADPAGWGWVRVDQDLWRSDGAYLIDDAPGDLLPTGSITVAFLRLTLAPGERLVEPAPRVEYYQVVSVATGTLQVAFLPPGQDLSPAATPASGETVRSGRYVPPMSVVPGSRRVLYNAGPDPVVLFAVRITPAPPLVGATDDSEV